MHICTSYAGHNLAFPHCGKCSRDNVDQCRFLWFQDFVIGLSKLSRGSIDEKLHWTFSLYDINGDGCITREEMTDIVTAVYELMGKFADNLDHEGVRQKVDRMFQVRDNEADLFELYSYTRKIEDFRD